MTGSKSRPKDGPTTDERWRPFAVEDVATRNGAYVPTSAELDSWNKPPATVAVAKRRTHENGAAFILDADQTTVSLWGTGDKVLWSQGEGLMVVGPQGVGKSTVIQQVVLHLIGVRRGGFLSSSLPPVDGKLVYLAMDRPMQIQRSFRRMVEEPDRALLADRLAFWSGPLPVNILKEPSNLADWIESEFGKVWGIVVDSYKDLAPGLSQDEVGGQVNLAIQEVIARGMQWAGLHHQRKGQAGNKRPDKLDDVYGAAWLTTGLGSVVCFGVFRAEQALNSST